MPFVKGQSGNPVGRAKKGTSITDLIREHGKRLYKDKKTRNEHLALIIWETALVDKDFKYVQEILNRSDGKVKDVLEVQDITKHVPKSHEQEKILRRFSNMETTATH